MSESLEGGIVFMMKRCAAFLLAAILLGTALTAHAAEKFTAKTAQEARTKAMEAFDVSALSMEYPGAGDAQGHLIRWGSSIRVYIEGKPTKKDKETINTMLLNLALRVPDMPNVTLTTNKSASNVQIYFVPMKQLKNYVPGYVEGNWGMFHYNYSNWTIKDAQIGIATDVTDQKSRNHLIQEEFFGALGLLNDHYLYSDSIVYQPWTTVQQPSEVDWLMLNMLYSPLVSPGIEKNEIHRIFKNAWSK